MRKSLVFEICLVSVMVYILVALFAPILSPWAPDFQDRSAILARSSWEHPMGTDHLGRDSLSRLLWGARVSLTVGALVTLFSCLLGMAVGIPSGFYGGSLDYTVQRILEVFLAFPNILLAIGLMSAFGPGFLNLIAALTFSGFSGAARLTRSIAMRLAKEEFVLAARACGSSSLFIMTKHILPNALPSLLVYGTTGLSWWIAAEAGLSFLGLGVSPTSPSWGVMMAEAVPYWKFRPLLLAAPCLALSVLSLSLNFLGDALEEAMDPRRRTRT